MGSSCCYPPLVGLLVFKIPNYVYDYFNIFSMFPAHAKNCLGWPQMGPGGFLFLLIQTLPTFWAERILILRILIFLFFCIPNSKISRSPEIWPGPGLDWAWAGLGRAWVGLGPGLVVNSQTTPTLVALGENVEPLFSGKK